MSATEELRRMLDERGVEYFKHEDGEPLRKLEKADEPATSWRMGGASVCAVPIEGSELFDLWIDHCTPDQAIAATLGRVGSEVGSEVTSEVSPHESNYEKLFGTPERAARTLLYVLNCKDSRPWIACSSCPVLGGCVVRDYGHDAQLEWLRGDA